VAEYPFTAEGLLRALKALGGFRDEVAATLRRLGVKGEPCKACECAIAVYVQLVLGDGYATVDATSVKVSRSIPVVEFGSVWAEHQTITAELPAPVATFVRAYDLRTIPDLIKEPA
jgi:hypothetical protein